MRRGWIWEIPPSNDDHDIDAYDFVFHHICCKIFSPLFCCYDTPSPDNKAYVDSAYLDFVQPLNLTLNHQSTLILSISISLAIWGLEAKY